MAPLSAGPSASARCVRCGCLNHIGTIASLRPEVLRWGRLEPRRSRPCSRSRSRKPGLNRCRRRARRCTCSNFACRTRTSVFSRTHRAHAGWLRAQPLSSRQPSTSPLTSGQQERLRARRRFRYCLSRCRTLAAAGSPIEKYLQATPCRPSLIAHEVGERRAHGLPLVMLASLCGRLEHGAPRRRASRTCRAGMR